MIVNNNCYNSLRIFTFLIKKDFFKSLNNNSIQKNYIFLSEIMIEHTLVSNRKRMIFTGKFMTFYARNCIVVVIGPWTYNKTFFVGLLCLLWSTRSTFIDTLTDCFKKHLHIFSYYYVWSIKQIIQLSPGIFSYFCIARE